ncbi:hypothetical protein A8L34_16315 [Bacillus sp. FJAT-27264]|uniref:hypothetical protein n=1 Tax=Paenibacillus sp. (strain DSM 101736 / FJAT-27264) TaxID=1850362 RepID=UPI0008080246|nr:hypothetical protein [Bacillus sp. FJAT-27264]OBZ11885.1 hypothetical protein A8L34_16315 [Bacillus sp. FJAT-27264]
MNTKSAINIRQSASISQLQEEVMFLKGQNEAVFKMLSYLTEQAGGSITIPQNFTELVIGSNFTFERNEEGDYVMISYR